MPQTIGESKFGPLNKLYPDYISGPHFDFERQEANIEPLRDLVLSELSSPYLSGIIFGLNESEYIERVTPIAQAFFNYYYLSEYVNREIIRSKLSLIDDQFDKPKKYKETTTEARFLNLYLARFEMIATSKLPLHQYGFVSKYTDNHSMTYLSGDETKMVNEIDWLNIYISANEATRNNITRENYNSLQKFIPNLLYETFNTLTTNGIDEKIVLRMIFSSVSPIYPEDKTQMDTDDFRNKEDYIFKMQMLNEFASIAKFKDKGEKFEELMSMYSKGPNYMVLE